jgi:hypothetical protein
MWIDRRIPNTDFGIWLSRIVAGIMAVGGVGIAIVILISFEHSKYWSKYQK